MAIASSVSVKKPIITQPTAQVFIDDHDVTEDILELTTDHKANAIDSFTARLKNFTGKYDTFFLEKIKDIDISLGHPNDLEKVFHGFVETPVPQRTKEGEIIQLSGLSTGVCLDFQEVPDGTSAYSSKTAKYIVSDVFGTYVELLLEGKILSSATTHTYDPSNKSVLTICKDMATADSCFFQVTPFDRLIFDQKSNMSTLNTVLDEELITSIKPIPDFSNIINDFTLFYSGGSANSTDTESQNKYYKRTKFEEDLNITNSTLATAIANEVIDNYKDPQWRYEVSVQPVLGLKVNHKVFLKTSKLDEHLKIESIQRRFSKGSYSISLSLQDSPVPLTGTTFMEPTLSSIYSSYNSDIRKLKKDIKISVDAAGISAGWEKIAEELVSGSAVTTVSFTGLDIDTDKTYMIVFNIENNCGRDSRYRLFINNDTTVTNYYGQNLRAYGSKVGAERTNDPLFVYAADGNSVRGTVYVFLDPSDYPCSINMSSDNYSNNLRLHLYGTVKTATVSNITQIDITAQQGNGIAVGSRIMLFKVKS